LLGYNRAAQLAKKMKENGYDIFSANEELGLIAPDKLRKLLEADQLLKKGFTVNDIREVL
jgi:fumarate hydratase class II